MKCQASYAGGCLYCMRCYLQWDANDKDRPECLTDQEVGQRTIERLQKLFNEGPTDEKRAYSAGGTVTDAGSRDLDAHAPDLGRPSARR